MTWPARTCRYLRSNVVCHTAVTAVTDLNVQHSIPPAELLSLILTCAGATS